ncbi:MAG: TerD family protein [Gammaproteobacteria bacterium]|nr:TerD family protein [Gammaproteobacteria bacterium]
MKSFIAGQKSTLAALTSDLTSLEVSLSLQFEQAVELDFSCFGVDDKGTLSDDRYLIFFNQTASPCRSLVIQDKQHNGNQQTQTFTINLSTLPTNIQKLTFTATLDGAATMAQIQTGYLRLSSQGQELARFEFDGSHFKQEKALLIGDLYLKKEWRFGITAQGFNGGLSALLAYFGGEEIHDSPPPANPVPAKKPSKLNLSKITLEKKGDSQTISLQKTSAPQPIKINLNWNSGSQKKGLFGFGSAKAPDLDLGCFVRMNNGQQGVIQPLGGNFGEQFEEPYILLDKDDRSGSAHDGENLTVYRPDLIDFMVVFAMIYEGADDFSSVDGRLTIKDPHGNETLIQLNAPDPRARFCVAAAFKRNGSQFEITKEERYFNQGHKEADEHYGFGFKWSAGSK